MKKLNYHILTSHYLIIAFFTLLFLYVNGVQAQTMEHYKLGPDDVISVSVFDEPDLSLKEIRVSSVGTIAMPLVGQIDVKGMTIAQVEDTIYKLYLGDYLKSPDINVTVVEYRQFYVNGEVNKPGGYSYREGMTVQRAITLAGGFTERASRSNIKLVREGNNKNSIDAALETSVEPGDVITVNESFF